MNANPPRETIGDAVTRPFWEAAEQRRLLIQRCDSCGEHQFYPRRFCRRCHAGAVSWVEASGLGRIYTMTRIWHSEDPAVPAPYVNALVELDEGPRLFTALVGGDGAIGQRVRVAWRERSGAPPLPVFEPTGEGA